VKPLRVDARVDANNGQGMENRRNEQQNVVLADLTDHLINAMVMSTEH